MKKPEKKGWIIISSVLAVVIAAAVLLIVFNPFAGKEPAAEETPDVSSEEPVSSEETPVSSAESIPDGEHPWEKEIVPEKIPLNVPAARSLDFANGKKVIALTFDDGPNQYLSSIAREFGKYNGAATFFMIGFKATDDMMPALQVALNNNCELANHSANHGQMAELATKEEVINKFKSFNDSFYDKTGYKMKLARLPYFSANDMVYEAMKEYGMPTIGNAGKSINELNESTTAEMLAANIRAEAYDGAIYCLHCRDVTEEAIKTVLPQLKEDGFEFLTVSELFRYKGYSSIPLGVSLKEAVNQ